MFLSISFRTSSNPRTADTPGSDLDELPTFQPLKERFGVVQDISRTYTAMVLTCQPVAL